MAYINDHYLKLKGGYLFPEIARRVRAFSDEHPELAKIFGPVRHRGRHRASSDRGNPGNAPGGR